MPALQEMIFNIEDHGIVQSLVEDYGSQTRGDLALALVLQPKGWDGLWGPSSMTAVFSYPFRRDSGDVLRARHLH